MEQGDDSVNNIEWLFASVRFIYRCTCLMTFCTPANIRIGRFSRLVVRDRT